MNNLVFLPKNTQDFCFVRASFYLNEINCTTLSISHFSSLTCRYRNNKHENDYANSLGLDFKRVVYAGEFNNDEGMEDNDLPTDLLRLVEQDEK